MPRALFSRGPSREEGPRQCASPSSSLADFSTSPSTSCHGQVPDFAISLSCLGVVLPLPQETGLESASSSPSSPPSLLPPSSLSKTSGQIFAICLVSGILGLAPSLSAALGGGGSENTSHQNCPHHCQNAWRSLAHRPPKLPGAGGVWDPKVLVYPLLRG